MNCLPQIHMYQTICKVMRAFETLISNCNFEASLKVWHMDGLLSMNQFRKWSGTCIRGSNLLVTTNPRVNKYQKYVKLRYNTAFTNMGPRWVPQCKLRLGPTWAKRAPYMNNGGDLGSPHASHIPEAHMG